MAEAFQPVSGSPRLGYRTVTGWFPPLTLLLFIGPVVVGFGGALLPAFSIEPGSAHPSLAPWRAVLSDPSMPHAVLRSLGSGFAATAVALFFTFAILAHAYGTWN